MSFPTADTSGRRADPHLHLQSSLIIAQGDQCAYIQLAQGQVTILVHLDTIFCFMQNQGLTGVDDTQ